ncbi:MULTISPECIES: hypothetical protein [Micromonospora]|uniref:hypothetical protein n=1 Tax=Micromonospora TaxID=1873 RepID=UPI0012FD90E9
MTWACCSSPLNPNMIPRACEFNCSRSASVTGGFVVRLPANAFGSVIISSYERFCASFVAYCS